MKARTSQNLPTASTVFLPYKEAGTHVDPSLFLDPDEIIADLLAYMDGLTLSNPNWAN
jgi:hypothetical protein